MTEDEPPADRTEATERTEAPELTEAPEVPEAGTAEPGDTTGAAPELARAAGQATKNPSLQGLSRTLQRGAAISAGVLVVTQVVSLVQTLAVARLLTPAEVGVFTGGTVLANFLVQFSEGGLKSALIQREDDLEDAADTVFWATLGNGLLMSVVAVAVAPLIGMLFGGELAAAVAAVTAGTLLLHALANVPDALMQRQFNFKRRLIVDPSTAGTFAVVAIVLSALGYGVWGLVLALYASQVVTVALLWTLAKWRPGRGRPSYRLWRELARFAYPLVISEVGQQFRELAEAGLVGRFLGAAPLGLYRYGRRIAVLPGTAIIEVASYVLFPAFARIAADPARMKRAFLRATTVLWVVSVPAAALLVAVGEPLVVVLLGERWRGAALVLVGMAGFGPGTALAAVGREAIKGAGASQRLNWVTGPTIVVGLGALAALIPIGLLGVGLAVSIETLLSGGLSLGLALSLASVSGREALRQLVPPVIAAAVAAAPTAGLEHGVFHSDQRGILLGLVLLAVDGLVFVLLFAVSLRVIAPSIAREVTGGLDKLRRTIRRRSAGTGTADGTLVPDEAPRPRSEPQERS